LSCVAVVKSVVTWLHWLCAVASCCAWTVWSDSYWRCQLWRWLGAVSSERHPFLSDTHSLSWGTRV